MDCSLKENNIYAGTEFHNLAIPTWKEAIGNFCTPTSRTNAHISEEKTMYREGLRNYVPVHLTFAKYITFSMLTLKN